MRTIALTAVLLIAAFPVAASPEGEAFFKFRSCVAAAAVKYAVLDQPITDIAAAAVASCQADFDELRKVVTSQMNIVQREPTLAFAKESATSEAIAKVADAKLAAQ